MPRSRTRIKPRAEEEPKFIEPKKFILTPEVAKEAGLPVASTGEYTQEQFKHAQEVGKIIEEGGRKVIPKEEIEEREAQAAEVLEEAGVFEEPGIARDLSVEPAAEAKLPIPGADIPSVEAVRTRVLLSAIDPETIKDMNLEEFLAHPDVISEPMLAEIIQTEVDLEVLKTGEAIADNFGTMIEAIPLVGTLSRKYAGGLITTPSSQIDDINSEISTQISYGRNIREWIGMGTISPQYAAEEFDRMEARIELLESKLQFLIIQSAELKSAPEEVNKIQEDIRIAKGVIFNGRQKVGEAILRDISPDATASYLTLQKIKRDYKK